jgi:hypothetical protein
VIDLPEEVIKHFQVGMTYIEVTIDYHNEQEQRLYLLCSPDQQKKLNRFLPRERRKELEVENLSRLEGMRKREESNPPAGKPAAKPQSIPQKKEEVIGLRRASPRPPKEPPSMAKVNPAVTAGRKPGVPGMIWERGDAPIQLAKTPERYTWTFCPFWCHTV